MNIFNEAEKYTKVLEMIRIEEPTCEGCYNIKVSDMNLPTKDALKLPDLLIGYIYNNEVIHKAEVTADRQADYLRYYTMSIPEYIESLKGKK